MPLKRGKRSSSEESTSVTDYNEDSLQSVSSCITTRKKKKVNNSKLDVGHCQEILNKLLDIEADDGHLLTDSFLRLPKKRVASDYYDVVTCPIDLLKIQSKIKNGDYSSFVSFEADMGQMVENAKMYHTASAIEYQDAVALWEAYKQEKQNASTRASVIEGGSLKTTVSSGSGSDSQPRRGRKRIAISVDDGLSDQISVATSSESRNILEVSSGSDNPLVRFFSMVVRHNADSGRDVTSSFIILPSRRAYPKYYEVAKEPLDFRIIAQNIKSKKYSGIDDLERDFVVMIKNAKAFYDSKSEAYQDAEELQRIIKNRRTEYDLELKSNRKRGKRTRIESNSVDKFAQMIYRKNSEESSIEYFSNLESSVDAEKDLDINPSDINRGLQCQLLKTVTNVNCNNGSINIAPFMKLPSKILYPDYYLEIAKPVSLLMIKAKIKINAYPGVNETHRDIDLVFENAKQLHWEGSGIFKDAVRLQNLAQMKRNEMMSTSFQCSQDLPMQAAKQKIIHPIISTPRRARPAVPSEEVQMKRIHSIFQAIYGYQDDGRLLRDLFMSLPLREQYPKYYQIIANPIDLTMIRKKIVDNQYKSYVEVVEDLKLMFSNAKYSNDESSQIHRDAILLEKFLKKRIKNFGVPSTSTSRSPVKKAESSQIKSPITSPVFIPPIVNQSPQTRIHEIYRTIKDYHDNSGRMLSEQFVNLPAKKDVPGYYECIKKPMEMTTIEYRINNMKYQTVDDFMDDLLLMFDNTCKFNEKDSQLYRDSLILLRVSIEKRDFLARGDKVLEPPNVQKITHEIMLSMHKQLFNHVDEGGRYFVDSLREIVGELITRKSCGGYPSACSNSIEEHVRLNLDVIKHHLEMGRYKRIDRLQEDLFCFFRYVRKISATNSQSFEDACSLQRFFIAIRDSNCERGEVLLTPALNYTENHLNQEIMQECAEKKITNFKEPIEDHDFLENIMKHGSYRILDSVTRQDNHFHVGDFVRIQRAQGEMPRVGEICALLVPNSDHVHAEDSNSDDGLMRVNWYYYPHQTMHKSTRRFMEKEIFQTSVYETVHLNKIVNKCLIMYISDFLKQSSKNFKESDIFVCESRYSVEDNSFKKLKNLVYKNRTISTNFISREESLSLVRTFSTFVSDIVNINVNDFSFPLESTKELVLQEDSPETESLIYYDQFVCDNAFSVKIGDYVYVNNEASRRQIVRIDLLWKDVMQNIVYFSGPWFIDAMEVDHLPTKLFYRKEVFLSSLEGATHQLKSIIGKCVILSFSDYCQYRLTEYLDDDVFVCQFKYFTEEKVAKKLKKGLKKAMLSTKVLDDEIYFFKEEIIPRKEMSPMLYKCSIEPIRLEYVANCKDSSAVFEDSKCNLSVASSTIGGERKSKKSKVRKPPSGYVIYSAEMRKKMLKENPEALFGMISKEVGQMWRNLPEAEKDTYERRAQEIKQAMEKEAANVREQEMRKNEAMIKQESQIQNVSQQIYVASPQNQKGYVQVSQPSQAMLTNSSTSFSNSAPIQYFQTSSGQVLQFVNPTNVPTSTITQLTSSSAEQQVQFIQQSNQPSPQVIYQIAPQSQSSQQQVMGAQGQFSTAQFMMHQNKATTFPPQISTSQISTQIANISSVNCNPVQPTQVFSGFSNNPTSIPNIQSFSASQSAAPHAAQVPQHFVSVSPRSSRVLHSDIYQKYIDKIRKNASTLTDWKQQLESSKESVLASQGGNRQAYVSRICQEVAPEFLDLKLLVDREGKKINQEGIVDSVFRLRDHLLQDAMNIRTGVLGFGEL